MGNTGSRRSKNDVVAATEAAAPTTAWCRKQRRDAGVDEEDEQTTRAGRRRPRAARSAGGGDRAATAPAGSVATVTVKVVMRRKDAEALAARLHAQNARARKARMAELKVRLRAGGDVCAGGAYPSPASCWSAQLAPIKES